MLASTWAVAVGTRPGVTYRIGAPLSAARPAAGIVSARGALAETTIAWWGVLPPSAATSSRSMAAATTAGAAVGSAWMRSPFGTVAEVATRITCAPPRVLAPSGESASRVCRVTAGSELPSAYRSGAPRGALASAEAASAAGQSCASTSTTACGRVAAVRPGYAVRAMPAASVATSAPPRRVVLRVARLTAPSGVIGVSVRCGPPRAVCTRAPLPQPPSSPPAMTSSPNASAETGRRGEARHIGEDPIDRIGARKNVQALQPSLQFASVPPRKPSPWLDARERGTRVVGANPAVGP